jgi:hypothetical protein
MGGVPKLCSKEQFRHADIMDDMQLVAPGDVSGMGICARSDSFRNRE